MKFLQPLLTARSLVDDVGKEMATMLADGIFSPQTAEWLGIRGDAVHWATKECKRRKLVL